MPVDTNEIMNLLSTLARDDNLKVSITQSLRGGAIAGGMAVAGGLIGGPIGLAGGSILGGCIAAATSKDFKSVFHILATMEPQQKEHLAERVRQIMGNVGVSDLALFATMVTGNVALRTEVLDALTGYLREEMNMAIVNG